MKNKNKIYEAKNQQQQRLRKLCATPKALTEGRRRKSISWANKQPVPDVPSSNVFAKCIKSAACQCLYLP